MASELANFAKTGRNVFQLMSETIPAKTFFIASTRNDRFIILDVFNKEGGCTVPSTFNAPLEESYCNMVVAHHKPLLIKNTAQSSLVNHMPVTSLFTIGSYLGVPIVLEDGKTFGTLCAMDPEPDVFNESHIPKLETFASLIGSTLQLEEYFSQLRKYETQTKRELQLSRKIQKSTLMKPLDDSKLSIDSIYVPSHFLSGDLCAWYEIEDGVYGVIVLDVMGHGVSSALIGMAITPALKKVMSEKINPYEVMCELNRMLNELLEGDEELFTFVTGIYALIDTNKQSITYMNAGHPPGLLINKSGIHSLDRGSMPLGIFKELPNHCGIVELHGNWDLLLYTDGLTDEFRADGEKGIDTIMSYYTHSKETNQSFLEVMQKFISKTEGYNDDICAVMISPKQKITTNNLIPLPHKIET
ncbi:GAF domain-containing SpoIIE family protein phosphatase [Alkalihalobacterium elongatum]|uniref:GAF domain-containing SpoIIE family protein phosphatase n=1 Tax=Alkalihalobacterium elongatum TaxID=2675466 RepID=UPI001C1F5C76|nr:GAF domain-containing SpoIIE family protein phosphatase [Alkalihalobacterium elongatum]